MRLIVFIAVAMIFVEGYAMPRPESSKGEEWRNVFEHPMGNLNQALRLAGSVKDTISQLKPMKDLPWKNPLLHH